MPLTHEQQEDLRRAIAGYSFPPQYYDFQAGRPLRLQTTRMVESRIKEGLVIGESELVKNALSNVLYWGFSQMGFRDKRVKRFRDNVTEKNLVEAARLFRVNVPPSLLEIKKIALPQFSGMSFVSKIRMFLDPENSATLDFQIMKIHKANPHTVLSNVSVHKDATQISITKKNSDAYESWCRKMRDISARYFDQGFRAVDIERGFFQLVQEGKASLAGEILKAS